jgi:acyl dehydratase
VPAAVSAPGAHMLCAMPVSTDAVGKRFPAATYAVGREKVREYGHAVGETNPLHLDPEAARAAGYADVLAPPMFAVVYCAPAMAPAILDPEVGMDFARMVHGGQEFVWAAPVVAGDEITTVAEVRSITERDGKAFYVFETTSENQDGTRVCTGTWTNIVRGV